MLEQMFSAATDDICVPYPRWRKAQLLCSQRLVLETQLL